MNESFYKITALALMFAGFFSSCYVAPNEEREKLPCDPKELSRQYPWSAGTPPWVFEMIGEWLENDICGRITKCDYRDGIGFLITPHEVTNHFGYSFLNCEGEVVYEGTKNPEDACPELNIKDSFDLIIKYPSWDSEQDGSSDEYLCHAINPFTLPLVKEMLYSCNFYSCQKIVSICTYRDGVGFLLRLHHNAGVNAVFIFLDCNGNLLYNSSQVGNQPFPELNIDYTKNILILNVSLFLYKH